MSLARDGQIVRPGEIAIAPNGMHMGVLPGRRIQLVAGDLIGSHRPAVTFMFSALARSYGAKALGVILTGIGRDGADGLAELHAAGGRVIAQDEATSVVYGMPRVVVEAGIADEILPISTIAAAIARACAR